MSVKKQRNNLPAKLTACSILCEGCEQGEIKRRLREVKISQKYVFNQAPSDVIFGKLHPGFLQKTNWVW